MKIKDSIVLAVLLVAGSSAQSSNSAATDPDPNREIKFEQRLNRRVSSTLEFTDESGRSVYLRDLLNQRPIVLAMGYYQCPMLCGVVLNALVQSLQDVAPDSPYRDFDFIFVSIDPAETAQLAYAKRQNYLIRYGWRPAATRWHFLTGSESPSRQLADEIGFRYRYDASAHQFVHPSGLVFLTPNGRISSYLLGIEYPAKDLVRAIATAREERVGSPVQQFLLLCFSGNAASGSVAAVVLVTLRIGAIVTLLGLVVVIRSSRGRVKKEPTR
jgi:protein SCO1/2